MRLTDKELKNKEIWEKAGIVLPQFDREKMIKTTLEAPEWVHFGAGNIFRIFPLALQQDLLERGIEKTGIIMVSGRDGGIVDEVFKPCDNLTLGVTLKASGDIEKKVIASAALSLWMGNKADYETLKGIFRAPSLKMASLTITEKAYNLYDAKGILIADAAEDCAKGPAGSDSPKNYLAKITALLLERFKAGSLPLALVSMDNCSRNGDKLFGAVETFAAAWIKAGFADKGFGEYLKNNAGFPCTMIDKITPGPDQGVKAMLEKCGFEDTKIYARTTPTAPFVNAEEPQYLVVEENFPAGRPKLEQAGVLFTSKAIVDKVEKMKVCTCLNPLHTALAIFGCLLGYTRISEEMKNPDLVKLVEGIGYKEGLPVASDPGILSPEKFIAEVIKVRFPNPFMPDTPQRIASDSSQKIPVRYGETLKAYIAKGMDVESLKLIPLVLAAWPRYLMGINDEGKPFAVSPDPRLADLGPLLARIKLGDKGPFQKTLKPIFSDKRIFGVDLYEAGLGKKVEDIFAEMLAGPGAVAKVLKKSL
ncbi:mannitol dehydrogenase family protein [Leadbettera azotonutricia]|uniref:Mannitol-1-phosphate/altronate dehydrogenase n=1 Tax=Leadbettera azotonutricia (strain ATCC BAA-888 / DSM 13862 / ZAS-9) TaxID=545695 RepID=F5YEW7_LEAAZ|nr:mannitol dehydrogenase family protein [Leadbettera azotonutricia]AEF80893.1 mannitol-1-phosphate/altronate dehydrogenase [Leadbettera azotonutricia ZAS-9]